MGRPRKDAFDEATDLRVLKAAEHMFGAHGYRQARLEDIASEAGIRRPSLLYHFGSKEALYTRVVERAFAKLNEAFMVGAQVPGDFPVRVAAITSGLVKEAGEHRYLMAVILRALLDRSDVGQALVERHFLPLVNLLESFVRTEGAGHYPADFPVRSAVLQSMMSHIVFAATGHMDDSLWTEGEQTVRMTRSLLLGDREAIRDNDE